MSDNRSGALSYYLPKPARPHTILHIPGSHTLYIGPLSCTRRHALHAEQYGDRGDISFLYITEADVISGSYEQQILEAAGTLLEVLDPSPRILFLAVFCIDDFLGTDEEALLNLLRSTYPQCQFAFQHIDPVAMNEEVNMGMKKQNSIYSFILPVSEHDVGINLLGHFSSLNADCELFSLLESWGIGPVRELFRCQTYEEYQAMGKSLVNLIIRPMGLFSAEFLQKRLGIPYLPFYTEYSAEAVASAYQRLSELLGKPFPDFSESVSAIQAEAAETVRLLDGMPVAVDSYAFIRPFAAAAALLDYGFNVRYIFRSSHKFKTDEEAEQQVMAEYPDITVSSAKDASHLYSDAGSSDCLAIGCEGARVLRAGHYVNIWHDEGYFGFSGIRRLLADIRMAAQTATDWSQVPELRLKGGKHHG